MNFKIVCITPLEGCEDSYIRVLKEDKPYFLYHNYILSERKIQEQKSSVINNLYESSSGHTINIAAIVGKNGTGKSTVIELLYAIMFNVAYFSAILPKTDEDGVEIEPITGLNAEVIYQHGNSFYQLRCNGEHASYRKQESESVGWGNWYKITKNTIGRIKHLFYSVVINYSHHSMNARHQKWLKYIFHKNDGYQTPIVINPFRDRGVINMDIEEYLTNARIVANLLTLAKTGKRVFNELAPGKIAKELKFTLNRQKVQFKKDEKELKKILVAKRDEILYHTFTIFKLQDPPEDYETSNVRLKVAYQYITKKLHSITQRYKPYTLDTYQFISWQYPSTEADEPELTFDNKKLILLLKKLYTNPSHITFKLRQAINFVNNVEDFEPLLGKFHPIDNFAELINKFKTSTTEVIQDLINVIPPSFFFVDIKFAYKNSPKRNAGTLKTLSSGERQAIYSAASWMYHLINLTSVKEEEESGYRRYDAINLIFDEVELYYHPDMQRDFVQSILWNLGRINLPEGYGINCILITHSPFILSDIPNEQILFLGEDGLPVVRAELEKTFASNIHDLLRNHFFLSDGTIGAFAKNRIESLISFLSSDQSNDSQENDSDYKWTRERAEQFISMVSEPIIRQSLKALFQRYYFTADEIQSEITRLIQLKDRQV